ncbi:MAG: hypothetical protein ACKO44_00725, partial [Algoriphagus sp.]
VRLLLFFLFFVYLNVNGQVSPTQNWVDSQVKYTDSKGNSVLITHSFPKGGGKVYQKGKKYGYVVFWTRMSNQSAIPIELTLKFPEVIFFKSRNSYIKIVLPKESMNDEKIQLYDYGLTNLQSLLNDKSKQLGVLQKKIEPKEEFIFYTARFVHISGLGGPARAKFELNGRELLYKISMGSDTTRIPCGTLYFKK